MYKQGVLRAVWSWGWVLGLSLGLGMGSLTVHATEKRAQQSEAHCNHVVINEFMSARQRVIADEDGDYEDWIELYNCSDKDIDLTDWYLSDRYDRPKQWQFPSTTIPAKGFLTLWASGKDRADGDELHTNFRIHASGEPLLLSDAQGELVDEIPPVAVNAHEAVGRYPDGAKEVSILAEPSFGASNAAPVAEALIEAPRFSHESGFYDKEFTLKLSHPDENVTIYYTLDGSEPDPDNLDGSTYRYKNSYQQPPKKEGQKVEIHQDFLYNEYKTHQYSKPIPIKDRTYEPDRISQISTTFDEHPDYFPQPKEADHWINTVVNQTNRVIKEANRFVRRLNTLGNRAIRKFYKVTTGEVRPLGNRRFIASIPEISYRKWKYSFKGTPVRAIAVKENEHRRTISPIATNTYFIGDRDQFSLPIVAITVPEKDLFDYDEGIFVAGIDYDEFLSKGKDVEGAKHHRPANWKRRSTDKLPSNIEIYNSLGHQAIVNESILINIHGNATRAMRNTSIRLYPSDKDGLDYGFFNFNRPVGFDRINLRNSGNGGGAYLKDAVIHRFSSGLAFGIQKYKPQIAFLNGEYYGILNARERRDGHYLQSNYGSERDSVDLIKANRTVQIGDRENWDSFIEFIENADTQKAGFFEEVDRRIDTESFIDFHSISIYLSRGDWPSNNNAYWRSKNKVDGQVGDGRWRWLLYDADSAMSNQSINRLEFATEKGGTSWPNPDWATKPLRILLENPVFREKFIIRFSDLINSTFNPKRVTEFIKSAEQGIEKEMPRHIARWKSPKSMEYWRRKVNEMVDFAEQRPAIQREHLKGFFDLGDPYTLNVRVFVQDDDGRTRPEGKAAIIKLNTLTLGVSDDELEKPVAASARATNMEKYLAFPWSGEYFAGMPIRLSVQPRPGYRFSHWEGRGITEEQKFNPDIELAPEQDTMLTAVLRR